MTVYLFEMANIYETKTHLPKLDGPDRRTRHYALHVTSSQ